ncbi:hypothetical protein Y032_0001g227 [Ancylostoma ceylanicum]|uniref:Uncharacterized protein n=1 Tax=Ancylostoma ceylanicum TaxID=53326 RepID=A0A016W3D8_9BILA|nr:hypothetical protein Y032_0001g227 [Ancylostoma ceylanicum]
MLTVSLILFTLFSQLLSDPTYIEELQDLLDDKVDIYGLERLKNDDEITRWEKMRKIRFLLMKQPKEVGAQYSTRMGIRKSMHDEHIAGRLSRSSDPEVREFWRQIHRLDTDWSISEGEAAEREFEMLAKLTPEQRKSLGNICRC